MGLSHSFTAPKLTLCPTARWDKVRSAARVPSDSAALQCVTISRYQPFFPSKIPVNEANIGVVKCNEIFALSYALGILEISFTPDTEAKIDFWLRLLDVITASTAQTLEAYSVDRSMGLDRPLEEYEHLMPHIHPDDRPTINALISIFELMSPKGTGLLN
jgi:hypothetical protein